MSDPIDALTQRFVQDCQELGQSEQNVLQRLTQRLHVSRDTNHQFEQALTFGQRLADGIAAFVGSWTFILIFVGFLMSQNRQAAKDRVDAAHDYEVNLKAELEILALHTKIDTMREGQWSELVAMQQEQIRLLTRLLDQKEASGPNNRRQGNP